MEKFVPFEKMSKRRQREENQRKRSNWGNISPVTRKSENKKIYNRKKLRSADRKANRNEDFLCLLLAV